MPVSFGQNAIADAARSLENLLTAKIRVNIAQLPLPAGTPSVPSVGLPHPGGPKWDRAIATETATRGHPVVRRAMADPNFARLAHDDVKSLTGIEKAVSLAFPAYDDDTWWNKAGHLIPFNGLVNLVQGAAGNRRGDTQNSYVGNEAQGLGRFVAGLGELVDVYGRYRRDMAAAGFAHFGPRDAKAYDTTAGTRTVAPLANALKARGQDLTSRVSKATPVTRAGGLAGNVVPGAVAAVVPGGQGVSAAYFAGQGADDVAQKARQAGTYGTPAADMAIAGNGVFQAGMSAVPIERLAAPLIPVMGGPLRQWLAAGAVKTGLATTQATAMTMGQNGLIKTMVDPKQDLLEGEGDSVGDMAFLAVLSHILHGSATPSVRRAAGTRARVDAVAENARGSTLRTRAPEIFKRVVKSAAANGPAQTVYIRPKPFVEAMQSPKGDSILQAMPDLADWTREAMASDSHIAIPVEDLATDIAPSDAWDGIADHLSLSPDDMSLAEVRDDAVGAATAIQAQYAAAQSGAGDAAGFNRSTQAVIDAVHGRLSAANPFSAEDNAVRARLLGQVYAIQASREGKTPEQLHKELSSEIDYVGTGGDFRKKAASENPSPEYQAPSISGEPFEQRHTSNVTPEDVNTGEQGEINLSKTPSLGHPETIQLGGAHKNVKGMTDYEAHHMPANSVSPLSTSEGPSIAMKIDDHRLTGSWGNSKGAKAHRRTQADLIDKGDFRGAQQMDIDDIVAKFGAKYNEAIRQMLEYTEELGY